MAAPRLRTLGVVFAAAIAAELLLVFVPRYLVLGDGTFHVSVAALFRDIIEGHGSLARHFYHWRVLPVPNLTADALLTALMLVFSPAFAEKILIAGYIVGLPLALRYAVTAIRPDAGWLAFFAFPLTFSFAFNFGFYDFSYSILLFLVVAGYVLRSRTNWTARRSTVLGALLVATYFTHLVGFCEALLFVGTVLLFDAFSERRIRRFVPAVLAIVPAAMLAVWFFASTSTTPGSYRAAESKPKIFAEFLALSWGITSYARREQVLTTMVALLLAVLIVVAIRGRWRPRPESIDAPLLFTLLATIAFAAAPTNVTSGGSFVTERLALFPAFGLVIWLSAFSFTRRLAWAAVVVTCLAAAGLAASRLSTYRTLNSIASDYMTIKPCIAHDSVLVQANYARALPGTAARVHPLTEQVALLAAETRGLDLGSLEGSVPYYLLQFRSGLDPERELILPAYRDNANLSNSIQAFPPPLDPLGYERRTNRRIDYVLFYARNRASREVLTSPVTRRFEREVRSGYRLVAVSPDGWVSAWERRGSPAAAAGAERRSAAHSSVCR